MAIEQRQVILSVTAGKWGSYRAAIQKRPDRPDLNFSLLTIERNLPAFAPSAIAAQHCATLDFLVVV